VTKHRRKCITAPILERLKEIFSQTAVKWECELWEFNGEPDHVHLLLALNPKVHISTFVNNIKTVSSRLIRRDFGGELAKTYRKPVFWEQNLLCINFWRCAFVRY
jgi:putative transposase